MENENTNTADEGTNSSTDLVEIPDASDADLEAFLKSDDGLEDTQEPVENPVVEEAPVQPNAEVNPQEDVKAPGNTEIEELKRELAQLKAQFDVKAKQVDGQETLIKRQYSKLADIQRALTDRREQLASEVTDELFVENPALATQKAYELRETEKNLEQVSQQASLIEQRAEAFNIVKHHIDPEKASLDDMASCLADDGLPQEFIQAFKQDPLGNVPPDALISLHRRAVERNEKNSILNVAKKLYERNQYLETQLKSGKKVDIDKVQQALRQTPTITAATGGTSSLDDTLDNNPAAMSDAEIEEFLRTR